MVEGCESSQLDEKCPSQVGYVMFVMFLGYEKPVCFQVQSVSIDGLSRGGVFELNQDGMSSSSRPDC